MSIYGPHHEPLPTQRLPPPVVRSRGTSALRGVAIVALLLLACGALYLWAWKQDDDHESGAGRERLRLQTAELLHEPAFEPLQTAEILPPASSRAVMVPADGQAAPPQQDAVQTAAPLAESPGRLQSASVLGSR